ncbi:hypothetical protein B0J11DRAFT_523464 [Dendryphion nanum]|uniref:Zn(2)-C6 fungal-type domain-containing protein n=1 Tax=Dendryphion nanum TaxID=256645 RepID=A0A9P9E360_9PLEO|nr:hypothetical protein B0J11DRAFT_523464 [Dendryphion nanum]
MTSFHWVGREYRSPASLAALTPAAITASASSQRSEASMENTSRLPLLLPALPGSRRALEPRKPKRVKTSTACEECRHRKTKCDGGRPKCIVCLSRNSVCQYIETARKQMQQKAQASDELLEMMKSLAEPDAIDILRRIRAGTDPQAIVDQIRDGDLLLQLALVPETSRRYEFPYLSEMPAFLLTTDNPYLRSPIYETSFGLQSSICEHAYSKPLHAAEVIDPLIDNATTGKWTSVISNDSLLRQLLKSFFQYAYLEWFPFHKDLFLSDMATGRTRFCSSLLVNAVLANASYSHANLSQRAKYWLPDNLTYKFTAEAKRLWELERIGDTRHLTTIQAVQILSLIMDFNGIDQIGRTYTAHALSMAHDLNLFKSAQSVKNKNMQKARIWTAWSLYTWQAMISYYFHQPPCYTIPPEDPLPDDPLWYGDIQIRYPLKETLVPMHICHSIKAKCELRTIKADIGFHAFTDVECRGKMSFERVQHFKSKIDSWLQNLPESLKPSSIVFPKDIGIHLEYLSIIVDLFVPHISSVSVPMTNIDPRPDESPADIVYNANKQKETLVRLYYLRHSFDSFDPMIVNFFIEQISAAIVGLNADAQATSNQRLPAPDVLRSTLILSAIGLRAQAKSYHVSTLAFLALQTNMLPTDLQLLLTYITPPTEADMPPVLSAITSWPLPIIQMNEDPNKSALNNMVKEYERTKFGANVDTIDSDASSVDY